MASLTPNQLQSLAYNAGFRGNDLITAVAVALAESGGNPLAYNPETAAGTPAGAGSRGLWQIYGAAHPAYNNSAVFDPQANANAAYAVYRAAGNRFTPWSTFNNGAAGRIAQGLSNATAQAVASVQSMASTALLSGTAGITGALGGVALPAKIATTGAGSPQPGSLEDWVFMFGGYGLFILGIILFFVAAKRRA